MRDLENASASTVASLFTARARSHPNRVALRDGARSWTYGELSGDVLRLAHTLERRGIGESDRIAVLSENRAEVLITFLAAAHMGAVVACPSTRLAGPELARCLELVSPRLAFASPPHAEALGDAFAGPILRFGDAAATPASDAPILTGPRALSPEAPLLILYTSGTTGLPRGAVLSHRALIARNLVTRAEYGLAPADAFVAWAPMFHMGGGEYSLGTLMSGGEVIVVDGFDADALATIVAERHLGWLILMPGMVSAFADTLEARGTRPAGVRVCGVMADLVPAKDLSRITRLLDAPYANTFGATETGNPPASAGLIPVGAEGPLDKTESVFAEVRLVDARGADVPPGTPGELLMRGPTLFSGYFRDPEATAACFEGGWFHMGDVFVRNADGTLRFVDRVKYLIKSGGENIYPAEIERVLLADPRVAEAAVVRRKDPRWGEVPVAFVTRRDESVTAHDLLALCHRELARYKAPKDFLFVPLGAFPRSASGKIRRHELEARLATKEPSS